MPRQSKAVPRICQWCAASFVAYASRVERGGGRFCSTACYAQAQTTKVSCVCAGCGKVYARHRCKAQGSKYCSQACQFRRIDCVCGHCQRAFSVPRSAIGKGMGKHCSQTCYDAARAGVPRAEKLWPKVDRGGGVDACHPFTGPTNRDGYGLVSRGAPGKKSILAHRLAWELTNGPIPDGLLVCHNCPGGDNPACCNPRHLWLGTYGDNNADMAAKGRSQHGDAHWSHRHPEKVARGERNPQTKLTIEHVQAIRLRASAGEYHRDIAPDYGISRQTVGDIVRRKRWGWVQ